MFERIIIIVDDNTKIESLYVPLYLRKINQLKEKSDKWKHCNFKIIHHTSMSSALSFIKNNENIVDVLVVDYDFKGESTFINGTKFIQYIRENVNQHCQVIFYTMQGITQIDTEELVGLINSDVYKMIDKSDKDKDIMAEAIFEAATIRNPIVESLERFFLKYQTLLSTYSYSFAGESISFKDMIDHIRMDDEKGRILVEKLMQRAILNCTKVEE